MLALGIHPGRHLRTHLSRSSALRLHQSREHVGSTCLHSKGVSLEPCRASICPGFREVVGHSLDPPLQVVNQGSRSCQRFTHARIPGSRDVDMGARRHGVRSHSRDRIMPDTIPVFRHGPIPVARGALLSSLPYALFWNRYQGQPAIPWPPPPIVLERQPPDAVRRDAEQACRLIVGQPSEFVGHVEHPLSGIIPGMAGADLSSPVRIHGVMPERRSRCARIRA